MERLRFMALFVSALAVVLPLQVSAAPVVRSSNSLQAHQTTPSVADCQAVYNYFWEYESYVVEYDSAVPLLNSLANGGYAEHDLLTSYYQRFEYLKNLHAGVTPPWQLQDFHANVVGVYYNTWGAFQNFDIAIYGGFMATILGPDEASGMAVARQNAIDFTNEAARLRGLVASTASYWEGACSVYNG